MIHKITVQLICFLPVRQNQKKKKKWNDHNVLSVIIVEKNIIM